VYIASKSVEFENGEPRSPENGEEDGSDKLWDRRQSERLKNIALTELKTKKVDVDTDGRDVGREMGIVNSGGPTRGKGICRGLSLAAIRIRRGSQSLQVYGL